MFLISAFHIVFMGSFNPNSVRSVCLNSWQSSVFFWPSLVPSFLLSCLSVFMLWYVSFLNIKYCDTPYSWPDHKSTSFLRPIASFDSTRNSLMKRHTTKQSYNLVGGVTVSVFLLLHVRSVPFVHTHWNVCISAVIFHSFTQLSFVPFLSFQTFYGVQYVHKTKETHFSVPER